MPISTLQESSSLNPIPSSKQTNSRQLTIEDSVFRSSSSKAQENFQDKLAIFFAKCRLAYKVFDEKPFRDMITAAQQTNKSIDKWDKRSLKRFEAKKADELRCKLLRKLGQIHCFVTLAIDGWTNVNHTKVNNIVLVADGIAYFWKSIFNPDSKDTADFIYERVKIEITYLLTQGMLICFNKPFIPCLTTRLM